MSVEKIKTEVSKYFNQDAYAWHDQEEQIKNWIQEAYELGQRNPLGTQELIDEAMHRLSIDVSYERDNQYIQLLYNGKVIDSTRVGN